MAKHRKHRKHHRRHLRGFRGLGLDLSSSVKVSDLALGSVIGYAAGATAKLVYNQVAPTALGALPMRLIPVGAAVVGSIAAHYIVKDKSKRSGIVAGMLASGVTMSAWDILRDNVTQFSDLVQLKYNGLVLNSGIPAYGGMIVNRPGPRGMGYIVNRQPRALPGYNGFAYADRPETAALVDIDDDPYGL